VCIRDLPPETDSLFLSFLHMVFSFGMGSIYRVRVGYRLQRWDFLVESMLYMSCFPSFRSIGENTLYSRVMIYLAVSFHLVCLASKNWALGQGIGHMRYIPIQF